MADRRTIIDDFFRHDFNAQDESRLLQTPEPRPRSRRRKLIVTHTGSSTTAIPILAPSTTRDRRDDDDNIDVYEQNRSTQVPSKDSDASISPTTHQPATTFGDLAKMFRHFVTPWVLSQDEGENEPKKAEAEDEEKVEGDKNKRRASVAGSTKDDDEKIVSDETKSKVQDNTTKMSTKTGSKRSNRSVTRRANKSYHRGYTKRKERKSHRLLPPVKAHSDTDVSEKKKSLEREEQIEADQLMASDAESRKSGSRSHDSVECRHSAEKKLNSNQALSPECKSSGSLKSGSPDQKLTPSVRGSKVASPDEPEQIGLVPQKKRSVHILESEQPAQHYANVQSPSKSPGEREHCESCNLGQCACPGGQPFSDHFQGNFFDQNECERWRKQKRANNNHPPPPSMQPCSPCNVYSDSVSASGSFPESSTYESRPRYYNECNQMYRGSSGGGFRKVRRIRRVKGKSGGKDKGVNINQDINIVCSGPAAAPCGNRRACSSQSSCSQSCGSTNSSRELLRYISKSETKKPPAAAASELFTTPAGYYAVYGPGGISYSPTGYNVWEVTPGAQQAQSSPELDRHLVEMSYEKDPQNQSCPPLPPPTPQPKPCTPADCSAFQGTPNRAMRQRSAMHMPQPRPAGTGCVCASYIPVQPRPCCVPANLVDAASSAINLRPANVATSTSRIQPNRSLIFGRNKERFYEKDEPEGESHEVIYDGKKETPAISSFAATKQLRSSIDLKSNSKLIKRETEPVKEESDQVKEETPPEPEKPPEEPSPDEKPPQEPPRPPIMPQDIDPGSQQPIMLFPESKFVSCLACCCCLWILIIFLTSHWRHTPKTPEPCILNCNGNQTDNGGPKPHPSSSPGYSESPTSTQGPYICTSEYCKKESDYIRPLLPDESNNQPTGLTIKPCDNFYHYVCSKLDDSLNQAFGTSTSADNRLVTQVEHALLRDVSASGLDDNVRAASELLKMCGARNDLNPHFDVFLGRVFHPMFEDGWPFQNDPPLDAVARYVGATYVSSGTESLLKVSVDVHPELPDMSVIGIDEPFLLWSEEDERESQVLSMIQTAAQDVLKAVSLRMNVDQYISSITHALRKLATSIMSHKDRLNGPENWRVVQLDQLSPFMSTIIGFVVRGIYNLHANTPILMKSPTYFQNIDASMTSDTRHWANYVGFRFLLQLSPLLPNEMSSMRTLYAYVHGRYVEKTDTITPCLHLTENVIPEVFLRLRLGNLMNSHPTSKVWASQIEDRYVDTIPRVSFMHNYLDDINVAMNRVKEHNISRFFPPWILIDARYDPYHQQILDEIKTNADNSFITFTNLYTLKIKRYLYGLNAPISYGELQYSVFQTNSMYDVQRKLIMIPMSVFNDSIPTNISAFTFHLARIGSKINQVLFNILKNRYVYRSNSQAENFYSERYFREMAQVQNCLSEDYKIQPSELKSAFLPPLFASDETAQRVTAEAFFRLRLSIQQTYEAFSTLFAPRRIWKRDFRYIGMEQFSSDQLFFIYYGLDNCEKADDVYLRHKLRQEGIIPAQERVNTPLRHYDKFREAFNCPKTSNMVAPVSCPGLTNKPFDFETIGNTTRKKRHKKRISKKH